MLHPRRLLALIGPFAVVSLLGFQGAQRAPRQVNHLADPFAAGWMLSDTNSDGVIDFIAGKVVVPSSPTAVENAAAADIAARLGFATTGLTPPVVISAPSDKNDGPRIWIGGSAVPKQYIPDVERAFKRLEADEGGVFAIGGGLAVLGHDDAGLLAAAEAFASRAPFVWKVPGERLAAILDAVPQTQIVGLTYFKGKNGIGRALIESAAAVSSGVLDTALKSTKLSSVHQLIAIVNGTEVSATNGQPMVATPSVPDAPAGGAAAGTDAEAGPQRLDLATLYTMRGLFRGTPRMPVPSSLDSQLYVPAGQAGIAMANLAARMGLETTGLTLPLATPASAAAVKDVRTKSVVAGDSDLAKEAERKLRDEDTAASQTETSLDPGEGELRIVDKAFGRQSAVLVRGDEAGASTALGLLSDHFPNLWEPGKQFGSLEETRYDLHRFFSLRSGVGQAGAALYRLDKWMDEIKRSGAQVRDVEAKVYVEIADPALKGLVQKEVEAKLGAVNAKVDVGSLRAGTQCCDKKPSLHYEQPGYTFHQGTPAFQEDLTIPWEGTRLINAVKESVGKIRSGDVVNIDARVSEGPAQRKQLQKQLADIVLNQGADPKQSHIAVLCAYKPGVSWLIDEIAPRLKGKPVASLKIEFKKTKIPRACASCTRPRAGSTSCTRWMKCSRRSWTFRSRKSS